MSPWCLVPGPSFALPDFVSPSPHTPTRSPCPSADQVVSSVAKQCPPGPCPPRPGAKRFQRTRSTCLCKQSMPTECSSTLGATVSQNKGGTAASQSLETVSGPRGVPSYSGTSGGEGPSQPVVLAAPSSSPTCIPHSPLSSPVSCCSGPLLPEEVLICWKLACPEVTQETPRDTTGLP